jgi:hypothetical protein
MIKTMDCIADQQIKCNSNHDGDLAFPTVSKFLLCETYSKLLAKFNSG